MTVSKIDCGVSGPEPTRPALETGRSTGPEEIRAAEAPAIEHRLGPGRHRDGADAAVLADEIDDRPAAFALSHIAKLQPRQLPSSQPTAHQQPQQHAIAPAFRRCRVGGFEELLDLRQGQPVAAADAGAAGAGNAQDGDGGLGGEQVVRGGLDGELAQGGERQVDRGRRQRAVDQMRAVALQRGPGEPCAGGMLLVPAKKLTERPVIGAAGVRAREPVEHQVHERRRRGRDRGQRYGRVAHRQMAAGSCIWRGRPGCCSAHSFPSRSGTQRSIARSRWRRA